MADNKITKNLNVAAGANRSPGRKYPGNLEQQQMVGGYKGMPNRHHKDSPSDKALENSYQRKIGQFGESVAYPKGARINVAEGNLHGGHEVYTGRCGKARPHGK